jgi:hypothetical protein
MDPSPFARRRFCDFALIEIAAICPAISTSVVYTALCIEEPVARTGPSSTPFDSSLRPHTVSGQKLSRSCKRLNDVDVLVTNSGYAQHYPPGLGIAGQPQNQNRGWWASHRDYLAPIRRESTSPDPRVAASKHANYLSVVGMDGVPINHSDSSQIC